MKKIILLILGCSIFLIFCTKKSNKDRAVAVVKSQYNSSSQKLTFDKASLDSLYDISPQQYEDSIKRGNELDSILAVLENQIEHLDQKESDSVGLISAKLTKERYQLLEFDKRKPRFIGWRLSGVKTNKVKSEILSFKFDKEITQIVP